MIFYFTGLLYASILGDLWFKAHFSHTRTWLSCTWYSITPSIISIVLGQWLFWVNFLGRKLCTSTLWLVMCFISDGTVLSVQLCGLYFILLLLLVLIYIIPLFYKCFTIFSSFSVVLLTYMSHFLPALLSQLFLVWASCHALRKCTFS